MPRARRERRARTAAAAASATTSTRSRRAAPFAPVSVKKVDLLRKSNQLKNETDAFESTDHLVLRRGFSFEFLLTVSTSADDDMVSSLSDRVTLELRRGERARFSRGTMFQAICGEQSRHHYHWKMERTSVAKGATDGDYDIKYSVHVPSDAPIGSYKCHIRVPKDGAGSRLQSVWEAHEQVVLLFNPWNKDDDVYMNDEKKREEYIVNESGLIWAGTHLNTFTWPWNFAQFEKISLEAVLYMLDMWDLGSDARRSPIHVSRCLANMVNSNDSDCGILYGLWSANDEDYADGTRPTAWSGSEAIFTQYMQTKRPVRYAQCWVFGGTLTSALRTIGIPTRPITNFQSAHDAHFNRAIDYYYDENDRPISEKSDDSIWNYHVWVESWMKRPDLGSHLGGWQALDATPQEISPHSRTMVVGPASIQAIKDGLDLEYDNEFVIAEVNADIKFYRRKTDDSFILVDANETHVGKHISTKAVGEMAREDITSHYKYAEGTAAERAALIGDKSTEDKQRVVQFEAEMMNGGKIGEDLSFEVTGEILSRVSGSINVTAVFEKVMYTGVVGKEIKKMKITMKNTGGKNKVQFQLPAKDYMKHLGSQPIICATFLAYVSEPEQAWIGKLPIRLQLPDLQISINGKGDTVTLPGGKSANVTVKLQNPLNQKLTNVQYYIEGTGLLAPRVMKGSDVRSGETATIKFVIVPRNAILHAASERNKLSLIVTAESDQLKGIMGTASVGLC